MRKLMLLVLMAAMLLMGNAVMAQDSTTFCGGLSDADCALLTESTTAMEGLTSASFTFSLDITADGAQAGTLNISGDGAFSYDAGVMASLADVDPNDLMAALDALKTGIGAFQGDLALNISGTGSAAVPAPIGLELLLVDGIGYLNFATVAPLLGGAETLTMMGLPTEWAGLDLVDTIEQVVALAGPQLEEMQGQMGDAAAMALSPDQVMALGQYFTFTREADADGAAVFSGTADLAGLLNDPTLMGLIEQQMEAQGQEIPDGAIEQLMGVADAFTINLTQSIDLETRYLRGLNFVFNVDGAALDALGAGSGTPNVVIAANINFADFNAAPAIAAPAGAPVATFMQLIGLFGAMGQ